MRVDCDKAFRWHRWFAWYPVHIRRHDCRWLEFVERRAVRVAIDPFYYDYEYREPCNE
jgi:hypothetical protein